MHRTKVRVATDVLDANDTIARANRADFARAGVRVVNLMSAPARSKSARLARAIVSFASSTSVATLTLVRCIAPPPPRSNSRKAHHRTPRSPRLLRSTGS